MLIPLELIYNPNAQDCIQSLFFTCEEAGTVRLGQFSENFGYSRLGFDRSGNQVLPVAGTLYVPEDGYVVEERTTRITNTDLHVPYSKLYAIIGTRLFEQNYTPKSELVLQYASWEFARHVTTHEGLRNYLAMVEERDWDSAPLKSIKSDTGTEPEPTSGQLNLTRQCAPSREKSPLGIKQYHPGQFKDYLQVVYVTMATLKHLTGDFKDKYVVRKRTQSMSAPKLVDLTEIYDMVESNQSFELYLHEFNTLFVFVQELTSDVFDGLGCFIDDRLSELNEKAYLNKTTNHDMPVVDMTTNGKEIKSCGSNLIYRLRSIIDPEKTLADWLGLRVKNRLEGDENYAYAKMIELEPMLNISDAINEKGVTDVRQYR